MKQENKNWTDDLRNCLADYEEQLPADGWERLEEELAAPMIIGVKHPYRRMAVAAAILLLLVSSACVYFLNTPASDYIKGTQAVIPVEPTNPGRAVPTIKQQQQAEITKTIEPNKPSDKIAQAYRETQPSRLEKSVRQEQPEEAPKPVQEAEKQGQPEQQETTRKEQPEQESVVVKRRPSAYTFSRTPEQLSRNRRNNGKDHKWSVGVSVGNGLLVSNDIKPGFGKLAKATGNGYPIQNSPSFGEESVNSGYLLIGTANAISADPEKAEAYRQVVYNNFDKKTTTDVKHHMPVTVGASIRFPLSKQCAIETGLNYTLLSSDLKAGDGSRYTQEQKLHYLGIPVKGSWMFFDKKYVTLYLSAGGAMEKCVSGKLKNTYVVEGKDMETENSDLDVKPLQWSVTSAVGIQFNATEHFGIYAEPGVSYYFDDGSDIQTIRKEKPFNFNLQLGFRVTY